MFKSYRGQTRTHRSYTTDIIWVDREREMFYLMTRSTHFIYGYMVSDIWLYLSYANFNEDTDLMKKTSKMAYENGWRLIKIAFLNTSALLVYKGIAQSNSKKKWL